MVRRAQEPEQGITLTGATNKQEFPAKVSDDAAQEDNRRRVQAVKEADAERNMLPEQREQLDADTVVVTTSAGTRVRTTQDVADALGRAGGRDTGNAAEVGAGGGGGRKPGNAETGPAQGNAAPGGRPGA